MTIHAFIQPAGRFEWERIVRRCRIGGKVKLVGFTLAQYGDEKGRNIRPGVARLAAVCEMGESTVRRHVDTLLQLGLIERVSNGGGPTRQAAVYRLVIPADLLERVPMLDPDEITPLTVGSGVRLWIAPREPVDNEGNSAQSDERSTERDVSQLRSVSGVTPLSLAGNSAHPGERPPRSYQPRQGNHLPYSSGTGDERVVDGAAS